MEELKVYSIENDTLEGEVDIVKLQSEISNTSYVTDFANISTSGGNIHVWGGALADENSLTTVVGNHIATTLVEYRNVRHLEIDLKTTELIEVGFIYDSITFSLSNLSQGNYDALQNNTSYYTWPKDISTKDSDTYELAEANVDTFWTAYKDVVEGHIETGRVLNASIKNAADKDAVDAIVDNR